MSQTPKCDAAIAAAATTERCPRCRYIKGHDATCPSLTQEQLRDVVTGLIVQCNRLARERHRAYDERERWHGKWALVKQENNALRKANRALRAELANLKLRMQVVTACANPPTPEGVGATGARPSLKLFEEV